MRKNGFTLIELLAVIVILAIIALIAVPLILNVIEKAKKGAFKDSTYGVMKAAEYASLSSRLESNFTGDLIFKFTDGELFNDNGIKLNYNGDTPKDGMLTVRADGKIQLSLTNGEYCARKDFDEIEISLTNISNPNDCEVELAILMAGTSAGIFDPSLGSPLIGPQIESIVFSKSKNVPSEAIGSWDVSEKQNESIIAWYVDSDNNDLYEVTIGSNGKIYANPDSSYLFSNLHYLKNIDFTNFDTSKVTNMSQMFFTDTDPGVPGLLTSLDLSGFDTSNVTNMYWMFKGLSSVTDLDISSFDTSNVTSMNSMFARTYGLTSLDLSHFNTSKVTDMSRMFDGSYNLETINLSSFDTSSVTTMYFMFYGTNSLNSIDLKNATFDSVTNYFYMFSGTNNGITIYTKDNTTKSWLEDRLVDVSVTGNVVVAP